MRTFYSQGVQSGIVADNDLGSYVSRENEWLVSQWTESVDNEMIDAGYGSIEGHIGSSRGNYTYMSKYSGPGESTIGDLMAGGATTATSVRVVATKLRISEEGQTISQDLMELDPPELLDDRRELLLQDGLLREQTNTTLFVKNEEVDVVTAPGTILVPRKQPIKLLRNGCRVAKHFHVRHHWKGSNQLNNAF